jgi:4-amino-4-deoxy-L-arabinose transferase-like glycosyltransferase
VSQDSLRARLLRPLSALRLVLTDPARRESAVLLCLAVYCLLWTIYGTVTKTQQGYNSDMTELIAWSRDLALGYFKHPPLAACLVAAWFAVFPLNAFSYYLLAMLMPTLALWIAWRLSADYLDADKRLFGLALLTLVPFFNFHALKFNVNTVLMPLWAATAWWFLRSYRLRSPGYAVLAGLGAALCMYGKYWSIFLLAGLAIAALVDRRRAAYFRSPAPWITIIAGALALAPHIAWLVQNNFAPVAYARAAHVPKPLGEAALSAFAYIGGSIAYAAVPLIAFAIAARPTAGTLRDIAWPREDDRRLAAAAFWLPFLLPVLGALIGGTEITSLWSMSAWTLLPVLLLCSPRIALRLGDVERVLGLALIVPFVMTAGSPGIAHFTADNVRPAQAQQTLLAQQIEHEWHSAVLAPLRYVDGDMEIAYGVVAAAADRPHAIPGLPPPPAAALKRDGFAFVCLTEDASCVARSKTIAAAEPQARVVESTIFRTATGRAVPPQRYTIVLVPPANPLGALGSQR